jgi:hypothetical protein
MLRCVRACRRVQHGRPRHWISGVSAGWGSGYQRRLVAFEDQGDVEEEAEADGQARRRRREHGSVASPRNLPSDLSFVSRVVKFFCRAWCVFFNVAGERSRLSPTKKCRGENRLCREKARLTTLYGQRVAQGGRRGSRLYVLARRSALPHQLSSISSSSSSSRDLFILLPMVASLPRGHQKFPHPRIYPLPLQSEIKNQIRHTQHTVRHTLPVIHKVRHTLHVIHKVHHTLHVIHHASHKIHHTHHRPNHALFCRREELRREFKRRAAISAQASSKTSSSTAAAQAFPGPASSTSKPHSMDMVPEEHRDPIEELSFDACITLLDMSRAPSAVR